MAFSPDVSSCPLGGGGRVGTHLSGAWCDSFGGPRYRPGGRAADSGWFPGGSHRRGHAFVSSLGGGGLAGDGDAHCGPCCGVFPVPGDISCASGSLNIDRGLVPPEVAAPVGLAVGSPARSEIPLRLVSPPASVADSGWFPGGSHRRGHAFVSDVGRRRGSGVGSLGGGGVAGDGDAHCGPCCGVFSVPGDISCASGSLNIDRGLASTGDSCSCWSGGGESSSERDPVAPAFPACFGGFLWTAPVVVGDASHAGCRSAI